LLGELVDAADDEPDEPAEEVLADEEPESEEAVSDDPVELEVPAPALSPEVESVELAAPRLSLR
jgi:hypothetical protein